MDINIEEQEAKLLADGRRIGEELIEVKRGQATLQQKEQDLINQSLQNQGALNLLHSLSEEKE